MLFFDLIVKRERKKERKKERKGEWLIVSFNDAKAAGVPILHSLGETMERRTEEGREKGIRKKINSGTNPIKILQHKFYAMLFSKHFDWLKMFNNQSKCLTILHSIKLRL